MGFFAVKTVSIFFLLSLGVARAECLDGSGDVGKSFEYYLADTGCAEVLLEWALLSPRRIEALDEVMRERFPDNKIKVYRLRKALEKKLYHEGFSMKPDSDVKITYQMLLEDGAKWEFAGMLSGFVTGGGSYFLAIRQFKKIGRLSRWTWKIPLLKFNPIAFLLGTVVAVGTSESALHAIDFSYREYLKHNIERDIGYLEKVIREGEEDEYWEIWHDREEERDEAVKSIVEDAMELVAIKERELFMFVTMGIQDVGSISEAQKFFGILARRYPQLLDEGGGEGEESRVAWLLSELESLGVGETEEALQPLKSYLFWKDSVKKLCRWYVNSEN